MRDPSAKPGDVSWERWEPNRFSEGSSRPGAEPALRTVSAPTRSQADRPDAGVARESAREEGYQAGFRAGRSDGLEAGREAAAAEGRLLAGQLAQAIARFDEGVARLEQDVSGQLLNLALSIARRIVGETLEAKPEVVLATIREAIGQLPAQHTVIHLNHLDAELVRAQAGENLSRAGHRIQENPQLGRGDVVVEAGGTQVDARLATRWQRVWDSLEQDPATGRGAP